MNKLNRWIVSGRVGLNKNGIAIDDNEIPFTEKQK